MNHTPGPWIVTSKWTSEDAEIATVGGNMIVVLDRPETCEAEDDANAMLMAAAPDLLAACLSTMHLLACLPIGLAPPELVEDVKTAIEKAGG